MEALQDKRIRLQPECKKRLQDRIDMWSYAAKVKHLPKKSFLRGFKYRNIFLKVFYINFFVRGNFTCFAYKQIKIPQKEQEI